MSNQNSSIRQNPSIISDVFIGANQYAKARAALWLLCAYLDGSKIEAAYWNDDGSQTL